MDCLNLIESHLPNRSRRGLVWHKRRPKLFEEYEVILYQKVKIGRQWIFVPTDDIVKYPGVSALSPFEGVE